MDLGGFCYGLLGQETPVSQAPKMFSVGKWTLNTMVSLKLFILLSKNNPGTSILVNLKIFFSKRYQDVFRTPNLIAILWGMGCVVLGFMGVVGGLKVCTLIIKLLI